MDTQKILGLAVSAGLIEEEYVHRCEVVSELVKFAELVRQGVLEEAGEYFDKLGKYKDGTWCNGWYEPPEPGEILRSLKEVE